MRKVLLILLLAMLPLQWSAAAVASLCLPGTGIGAQATASVPTRAGVQADEADHAHGVVLAATDGQASHHAATDGQASRHHGDQDPQHDGKTPHTGHGGCCHAAGSALPTRLAVGFPQATPGVLIARMTVLAVSHPSDSPFRPPRLALA